MTKPSAPACEGCHRSVTSHRIAFGGFYCQRCRAELPRATCVGCGATIVHRPDDPRERCPRCENAQAWIGQPCVRCGTLAGRDGLAFEGRAFCRRHKRHAQPEKQCSYCSRWHTQVYASPTAGLDKPACQACIRDHSPVCSVCKRFDRPVGEIEGKPACAQCMERGTLLTKLCRGCGRVSSNPNSYHCSGCGFNTQARRKAAQMREKFATPWVRALFDEYANDLDLANRPGTAVTQLKRSFDGFVLLELHFESVEEMTVTGVLQAFSSDTSNKRFRGIKNWLATKRGLNFDAPEAGWFHHQKFVANRLSAEPTAWVRDTLSSFMTFQYERRAKYIAAKVQRANAALAPKSLELALKYAQWFLHYCQTEGVESPIAITQAHLDSYAVQRFKVYQSLGSFVRYLNRTSHRLNQVGLPTKAPPRNSLVNRLSPEERSRAVGSWLQATNGIALRNATIALLSYFYLLRLPKLLTLKRSAIRILDDGTMEIDFGQGYAEIDPDIATVVRRWQANWFCNSRFVTQENDDHLFPGISPNRPCSCTSFSKWLRKTHGFRGRQLFATGVHNLLDEGVDDPGMLVYYFGLSPSTAIKYWKDSGRNLMSYIHADALQLLREQGCFDAPDG